jgi:hypothetical protein
MPIDFGSRQNYDVLFCDGYCIYNDVTNNIATMKLSLVSLTCTFYNSIEQKSFTQRTQRSKEGGAAAYHRRS